MRDRILLVMAKRAGRWIAGAINFIGSRTLFGRHWGAIEHHPFLHFELCYYQAIEYAIAHKLARVEAGAQGEHKIARGYMPTTTYSAHYIADPALRRAIADYLERERAYVAAAGAELAAAAPVPQGFDGRGGLTVEHDLVPKADVVAKHARRARCRATIPTTSSPRSCAASCRLQGLRGRQGVRLSRHHAARARPHAGDPEGAGAQHPRRGAGRSRPSDQDDADDRRAAVKAFSADGITIQQFNEPAGGQVVFHLHVHVIPRKIGIALKPPASFKEEAAVLADHAQAAAIKGA